MRLLAESANSILLGDVVYRLASRGIRELKTCVQCLDPYGPGRVRCRDCSQAEART